MLDKDKALGEFDSCVEKHIRKTKNAMYGIISHAYNEGVRDGRLEHDGTAYDIGMEDMLGVIRDMACCNQQTQFTRNEMFKYFETGYWKIAIRGRRAKEIMEIGKQIYKERSEQPDEREDTIEIGDEVAAIDSEGNIHEYTRFFVTEYEEDEYIGGITLSGKTHFHCKGETEFDRWVKTGRHYDVRNMFNKMSEEVSESKPCAGKQS